MTDTAPRTDSWTVAGRTFNSRLIVGTGKYRDYAQNAAAAEASGAEMVTVAVRRVNLTDPNQPVLTDFIDPKKYTYLPNTAGCFTGEDAVRTLRLAREAGGWTLVKLEVLADPKTLFPDMEETLRSLKLLTAEGFEVMVYCTDDPVYAEPDQHPPDRGAVEGAGAGRRRRRHGVGRSHRHGVGLRRRADEHRHRRGARPPADGQRHEARGHRGA